MSAASQCLAGLPGLLALLSQPERERVRERERKREREREIEIERTSELAAFETATLTGKRASVYASRSSCEQARAMLRIYL
jgi:hypothetical protein